MKRLGGLAVVATDAAELLDLGRCDAAVDDGGRRFDVEEEDDDDDDEVLGREEVCARADEAEEVPFEEELELELGRLFVDEDEDGLDGGGGVLALALMRSRTGLRGLAVTTGSS